MLSSASVAPPQCDQYALTPTLSAVPLPLEGLTVTDSGAEGDPCSELSRVGGIDFSVCLP